MTSSFKLAANLPGHSQDVKSLKFINPDTIYSCARDTTARVWKKDQNWFQDKLYQNPNPGFLNAVEAITYNQNQYLISAGQDALIQLWPIHPKPDQPYGPEYVLAGHTSNVCCLNVVSKSGEKGEPTIISGSWDCSAIVWRNTEIVYILRAHSAAVWAVLGLGDPQDTVLTAGADNLIMLWKSGMQEITFKGHTQAVRALVLLPRCPELFASAGNDATVRIWNLDGSPIRVLDGHDSFIYSMCSLPTGEIVSSGEDRSVRIWNPTSGKLSQTIIVPAISVWTVSACPQTGDISCGSSDSIIRIFTREDDRVASAAEISQFEQSVKASSLPSATVGDLKKSDLPTVQVLLSRRGTKEGEVAMAKNETNGAIEAYQWDGTKGDWTMVGTVVDGIGSARKQLYEGKEYDYVFDVDIKDGAPAIKLPYNATDNPYTVAQKWLAKHELPETYVDQIVEFIDKNTSGVPLGGPTTGADPFTGAGSYRPGHPQNTASSFVGADPFTGAGSYRPTGSPNPSADSQTAKPKPVVPLLPHKSFLIFPSTNLNFSTVLGKIKEFNSSLDGSAPSKELSRDELEALEGLTTYLAEPTGEPPATGVEVVKKMIENWPVVKQFPALDLVRITALAVLPADILPLLLAKVRQFASEPGPAELNFTLALRALSNAASSVPATTLSASLLNKHELAAKILEALDTHHVSSLRLTTKNAKVALATLLLNLSILALEDSMFDSEGASQLVGLTCQIVGRETEEEAVYRSLVGLGNWVVTLTRAGPMAPADAQNIATALADIAAPTVRPNRLADARHEIHALIN